ncbi:hypothetical protein Z517_09301 [Fonsecaea pedrosoi CBS 271.37]|uniref:Unplaced genomic scaffold supercont1.6, whole genome shotgun sequence n=1 Tax=Fonsecaea pedrosoi CBS 271.37 TaxID=1442368 RepID=A0A0D2ERH4_9EURO|nr:uncharacterized protein Z517_09301 [Fonsecaea pedrosoi CBS 271.37]KIW76857.1 hypothetical protein Z517_09301 [Fonsecaea pedrosoi CBS 271.37]
MWKNDEFVRGHWRLAGGEMVPFLDREGDPPPPQPTSVPPPQPPLLPTSNPTAGETPSNMTDHRAVQQGAIIQNEVNEEGVITQNEETEDEEGGHGVLIETVVNHAEGVITQRIVSDHGVMTRNMMIANVNVEEGTVTLREVSRLGEVVENEVNEQEDTQVAGDQTDQEEDLESVDDNFATYGIAIGEINSHNLSNELVAAREKLLTFTDRLINYTDVGTEPVVDATDREDQGMSQKAEYLWGQVNYSWLTLLNGQNDLMSDAMACMLIGLWTGRELFSPQHHAVTKKVSEVLGQKLVSLGPWVSGEGVSPPTPLAVLLFGSETSTHPLQRRCKLLGETLLALSGSSMGGAVDETMARETAQVLGTLFDRAESKIMGSESLKLFDLGLAGVKEFQSEFIWLNDLALRQYFSPLRPDVRPENLLSVENLEEMASVALRHSDKLEPKGLVDCERGIWEGDIIDLQAPPHHRLRPAIGSAGTFEDIMDRVMKCVDYQYYEMVGRSTEEKAQATPHSRLRLGIGSPAMVILSFFPQTLEGMAGAMSP